MIFENYFFKMEEVQDRKKVLESEISYLESKLYVEDDRSIREKILKQLDEYETELTELSKKNLCKKIKKL